MEVLAYSLGALGVLGLSFKANQILNFWASNNWRTQVQKDWNWHKEIAVVTGGCSGIGNALVLGLVQKGVKVAVLDIQDLPENLKAIEGLLYLKCDVTSAIAVEKAAEAIKSDLGDPSILVNNAGIGKAQTILEMTESDLQKIFGVNIQSHWYTTKCFLPAMISRNKGQIVTIASMSSFLATPNIVAYSSTKAGALAFHEGLTSEIKYLYKAPGVITTIVHPSWVLTPLTSKNAAEIEKATGRLLTVDEVAQPILDRIFECQGGPLLIPSKDFVLSIFRALPTWVQEGLKHSKMKNM
jgi:all-trans-retinol dehydrogenase (NAD+)